jgi:hypothetical protein
MCIKNINKNNPVIAWWSGGVTSAVTCHLCLKRFGADNVRVIFIDTHNEDDDTCRFKRECEAWYEKDIETVCSDRYRSVRDVWYDHLSLNVAHGAVCSYYMKRVVREQWERSNRFHSQAFGFDIREINRAKGMKNNNPKSKPFFPLISELLRKEDCMEVIRKENTIFHPLRLPNAYYEGYHNNNCFKTGCVQGGIGYWQKIRKDCPDKFDAMATVEHELTGLKRRPVTLLRDRKGNLVFLKPHPDYPDIRDISMMKGRPVLPLIECNGFCGMDDIEPNKTMYELNLEGSNENL